MSTSANQNIHLQHNSREQLQNLTDKFRHRLLIPIRNLEGQIVGFTGRTIEELEAKLQAKGYKRPKYLNSPTTPWFPKGKLWFGLDKAKGYIRQYKFAIVVEGHLDVITAHRLGLKNVIASQGTSFTKDQLTLLLKFCQQIWLCFDQDQAGRLAAQKFFKMAAQLNFEVFQVLLPNAYKDLDEYLLALEKQQQISPKNPIDASKLKKILFLDFLLQQKTNEITSKQTNVQKQAILEFLEFLVLSEQITQEQYLYKLSELTNYSTQTLREFLNKVTKQTENSHQLNSQTSFKESNNSSKTVYLDLQPTKQDGISSQQACVLSFQKLAVLFISNRLSPSFADCLPDLFAILKQAIGWPWTSWQDYLQEEKEHLDFIAEQILTNQSLEPTFHLRIILNFLEQSKFWSLYPEWGNSLIKLYRLSHRY